jgi:hypothetical protein
MWIHDIDYQNLQLAVRVEHNLAKVGGERSNPFARSRFSLQRPARVIATERCGVRDGARSIETYLQPWERTYCMSGLSIWLIRNARTREQTG